MGRPETRPTEVWCETKAELSFGPADGHFWIRVGPMYDEAMTLRLHGGWAKDLYESLGRYLKGESDETHRDDED